MTSNFQSLIDSDAFVGSLVDFDAHHERATKTFHLLREKGMLLVTTSLVVAETATVLSHRVGQQVARTFLEIINRGNIPVMHITEDLQQEALAIFADQTQKGTSVTDCANVAFIRRFNIPTIFSFDQVYSKSFGLKMASEGY